MPEEVVIDSTSPTWPPIEILFKGSPLPEKVKQVLTQRYNEHSKEYASSIIDERSELPINSCMFKDNLQDVEEELVDAIFNALVYQHRFPNGYGDYLLGGLLIVWSNLQWIREEHGKQDQETPSQNGEEQKIIRWPRGDKEEDSTP